MPGSTTLSIFSMALLVPVFWKVDPPDKWRCMRMDPASFHADGEELNPDGPEATVEASHVEVTDDDTAQLGWQKVIYEVIPVSSGAVNVGLLSMLSTWRNVFLTVVALAEAAIIAVLLVKHVRHRRTLLHEVTEDLSDSTEEICPSNEVEDAAAENEALEISAAANDEEDNITLRKAVERLAAENEALKKVVHAAWQGDAVDIWDFDVQHMQGGDHTEVASDYSTGDDGFRRRPSDISSLSSPAAFSMSASISLCDEDEDLMGFDVEESQSTCDTIHRFSSPYTPSTASSASDCDAPEDLPLEVEIQPKQPLWALRCDGVWIRVHGTFKEGRCFSSPYPSSHSDSSDRGDEDEYHYEAYESLCEENEELIRQMQSQMASGKWQHEKEDLVRVMLARW